MKTRSWILIFAAVAAVCLGLSAALRLSGRGAQTAEILVDGAVYQTLDLTRDQTITVTSAWGENTVTVENGEIFVSAASCPDGVCVEHGPARAGDPAVCLPNRLVVRLLTQNENETDAVAK